MKIFKQPRQSGKSYDIAKMMKECKNCICIQPTESQVSYFCKSFDIPKSRVFTVQSLLNKEDIKDKVILIDEVGMCISIYLRKYGHTLYGTHTD